MPSALRLVLIALVALLAAAAFAFLLKLMHDMSQSMGRMTEDISGMSVNIAAMAADMHRMGGDIGALSEQVAGIRVGVDVMASDVRGMRGSVDRMSEVVQTGGKQIERINPMGVMQDMFPAGR